MFCKVVLILSLVLLPTVVTGYRPVILLHGVLSGSDSMKVLEWEIKLHHPGTVVYNIDRYGGWTSLEPAWTQVKKIGQDIMDISNMHPEGVILLGYSQGGILSRAVLESFPNHSVKKFISLSSPQAGQFGDGFLHLIFPDLVARTAFELFYSRIGQKTSVGNYWNDPFHHELYLKYSNFLPYINNEIESDDSDTFKNGILKLEKMILIGGPHDGVITPWESSQFGFYDQNMTVIDMKNRDIYMSDNIGLQQLDKAGKLEIHTYPHITHLEWHLNLCHIKKIILPLLD